MRLFAFISNIVLSGFSCWAIVSQYPHPREDGVIAYTVLVLLTPVISLVVIFCSREDIDCRGFIRISGDFRRFFE